MATSIGTAWIQIKPTTTGLRKAISSELNAGATSAGEEAGGKISSGITAKLGAVAGIASNIFGKISNVISSSFSAGIERASVLSNYTNVMSNLNIAQEDAQASITKMADKLTGLPTALDDAALAVQRFTSKNSDVAKSTDMFLALNNALIAGGASSTVQAQALEQISQAYAKGKPDLVEWRSIMQSMPAQAAQIAQSFDMDAQTLGEALRRGTVSMDEFMQRVMELNTEGANGFAGFEEQAKKSVDTLQNRITVMKQSVTKTIAAALNGDDIEPYLDQLVERVNAVAPQLMTAFVKAFLGIAKALPKIIPPLLQAIMDMLPDIIKGISELLVGIVQMLPQLIPIITNAIPQIINAIVTSLLSPESLSAIFTGAVQLMMGIIQAIPQIILALVEALPDIITNIVDFLTNPDTIMLIIEGSIQLFFGIVKAVPKILGALFDAFGRLFSQLWEVLKKNFGEFVSRFGEFIKKIFTGAVNIVLEFLENVVNTPIHLLNYFIDAINWAFGWLGVNIGKIELIKLPRLAQGGVVGGVGTDTSDSNLVALSKGEYVIRAAAARQIGYDNLDAMNETGTITGGVTNNFTINGYQKSPEELANIISRKIAFNTQGVIG